MIQPLSYQIEPIERHVKALKRFGSTLDASDTGTGKTYVALFVAKQLGVKPTIICPKAVIEQWKNAAIDCGVALMEIKNYEKAIRQPMAAPELIIFDESHRAGGIDTKNAMLAIRAKQQRIPHIFMSATPADSPLRMKALGYSLDLFPDLKGFWPWMMRHGVRRGPFGFQFYEPHMMAKIHDAIGDRLVRVRKMDVPGFPKVQNHFHELPKANVIPERDDYIARRQAVELGKVPQILEMISDRPGSKVIFVSYRETFHRLVEALEDPATIYGGQDEEDRIQGLEDFQANRNKVVVAMIQAGGAGVSLHDTIGDSPRTAFICLPESAVHFKQALGRINRAGQKSFAQNLILHSHGTFENRIKARVGRKIESIDKLNDADLDAPEIRNPKIEK